MCLLKHCRWLAPSLLSILVVMNSRGVERYVATDGDDVLNDGMSVTQPLRTVLKALTVANYGDTIYLRGGTYREHILYRGFSSKNGGSASNMLHLLAYSNEVPVISGAVVIPPGWKAVAQPQVATCAYSPTNNNPHVVDDWIIGTTSGTVWSISWTTRVQQVFYVAGSGTTNESRTPLQQLGWSNTCLDWIYTRNGSGWNYWDIRPVIQTNWTDWSYFWSTNNGGTLYLRLAPGVSPSDSGVSIEAGQNVPFTVPGDYLHVKGVTFRHSNAPGSSTAIQVAFGRYCLVEDCVVEWMDLDGLVIYEGTVLTNCAVRKAGRMGLVTPAHFTIVNSQISSNNCRLFPNDHSASGIKCANFPGIPNDYGGTVVANNEFIGNNCFAFWVDTQQVLSAPALIYGNLFAFNGPPGNNAIPRINGGGIFMEDSGAPTGGEYRIYNNLFVTNRNGVVLNNSSSCKVLNNTIILGTNAGAFSLIGLAHRSAPVNNAFVNNVVWQTQPWPSMTFQTAITKDGVHYDLIHTNLVDNNCYSWPSNSPFLISMCNDDWSEVANTKCQCIEVFSNYVAQVRPAWERSAVLADPKLGRNRRPGRTSPVLGLSLTTSAGVTLFPVLTDYTGRTRLTNSSLGALEFFEGDSVAPPPAPRVQGN